jgi:hypothetical protein
LHYQRWKARCQYKNIFPAPRRVFFSAFPGFSIIGEGRISNSKNIMMQVMPATAGQTTAETPATEWVPAKA